MCFTSLALSPTASLAASARVPADALLSCATSIEVGLAGVAGVPVRKDVLLLVSLEVESIVPLTVSDAELAAFLKGK